MNTSKHSILIVDDSNLSLTALTRILEADYTLFVTSKGGDAIAMAEEHIPDLILLDIIMADMDGYEVITALKNSEKTKQIPIIFITGLNKPGDEERGLALGAADYITKPFSPATIRLRVKNQITMLEQLRANEYNIMKHQLTGKALNIGLWDLEIVCEDLMNPVNKFTWSPEFRQMLGFSDEKDFPNVVHSWTDRLHPEDKARTLAAAVAHLKDYSGQTPYDVENRIQLKNGEYRYFHAIGTSMRNSAGVPLRAAGAIVDITEKRRIAEMIQYRNKMLNALNEMALMLLSHTEATFDLTMSSAVKPIAGVVGLSRIDIYRAMDVGTEKYFGQVYRWSQTEGGTAPLDDKLKSLPVSQPPVADWVSTLTEDRVVNIHTGTMSRDETLFLNEFEVKSLLLIPVFKDSELWGIVAFQDNINNRLFDEDSIEILRSAAFLWANAHMRNDMDHEIAEAYVRLNKESRKFAASSRWYKSILDAVSNAIFVTDAEMNWTFVNKAVEDELGMKFDEMLGKPCSCTNSPICKTEHCSILRAKRGEKCTYFNWNDRSFQVNVETLQDIDGQIAGFIEVVQDITEVQRLAKERANAEAASKAKSAFLAMMSHEIRTPMNAIWGITELLVQDKKLSKETLEAISRIHNSCGLLLGLINDILDFSKIEAGKLDITPAQYNVASLINDVAHMNMMRIGDKPIEFELHIDENIPAKLIGDELRIKQVLSNILSNAFKYTDTGTVTLSAASESSGSGVTLILGVRDTGIGLSEEQIDKLFDEYARFREDTNCNIEGTGLGLPITHRLVSLMKGEIQVKSGPEKGSLFTVRLPQERVDGDVLGKELAANLQQFRTNYMTFNKSSLVVRDHMPYGSVLIVDDMETNIYVAVRLLKPYGLKIDTAMSGLETLEKVKGGKVYDVVFMDHMMPKMDGIETAKRLRESGYTCPIVALTANAVAGQADMFLQNGFDAFVSKPIDIRQLNSVLNKLIRDKQPPEVIEAARRQKRALTIEGETDKPFTVMNPLLLESVLKDTQKSLAVLEGIFQRAELGTEEGLQMYIVTIHGIKGALGNIREMWLAESARKLEEAGRGRNIELLTESTPEFLTELRGLLQKLEASRDTDSKGENIAGLRERLLAIEKTCSGHNKQEALELLSEAQHCSEETKTLLTSIREYVLQDEFKEAAGTAATYANVLAVVLEDDTPPQKIPGVQSGTLLSHKQIDGLDILKGLERFDGNEETYLKFLRSYVTSMRSLLGTLKTVDIKTADREILKNYEIIIHGIKGASSDIFAGQVDADAYALEIAAKAGDVDYMNKHHPAFLETAWKLVHDLEAVFSARAAENPKPKKDKPDDAALSKLLAACRRFDMEGTDTAMAEISRYHYESDDGLADWLHDNVDLMHFEEIAERLSGYFGNR